MNLAVVVFALGGEAKARLRLDGAEQSPCRVATDFRAVFEAVT